MMTYLINFANFTPKLRYTLRNYTRKDFFADLIAGLTTGLVALPLAMAFAISSGVPPQAGIYTAIIAGFIISALGGSRTQIGGPTGAFVVVIAGIIQRHGIDGLYMVTILAGLILIAMALTGMGTAIKFIPRPVIIGFTNGIALLIASTQIKDFLGLTIAEVPSAFLPRLKVLALHLGSVNYLAIIIALASLGIILIMPRLTKRVPGQIVALLAGTLVVGLSGMPVETIASRFGGIPGGFPSLIMPKFDWGMVGALMPSAVTVALLAALESLLSAVVADGMSGDRHNPNAELLAQGVANFATPFFGGIPATGAIARTATNIRSGAKTPVAGIVHALILLLILLVAAPLARYIPLATLAGVLLVVAYNMGEWHEIAPLLRQSTTDRAVWGTTFALTVLVDLTVAVQMGMLLAVILYVKRVSQTTSVSLVTKDEIQAERTDVLIDVDVPSYISLLRIHGPFLFGTTDKLLEATSNPAALAPIVILRLRKVSALDHTGLHAIAEVGNRLRRAGKHFMICGAQEQPAKLISKSELPKQIGSGNILPNIEIALAHAEDLAKKMELPGLY